MKTEETRAIVLYNKSYRESDRLVKLFTETAGKRMFFVKQVHRSNLQSVIQPLTVANFILTLNETGLSYIVDYKFVKTYPKINKDIFKLAYATYIVTLADAAVADKVQDPQLFAFLVKLLDLMEQGLDYEMLTILFELQLLERFGVQFNFNECQICHKTALPFDFSHQYLGLLCPNHYYLDTHRSHLDPNVLYLLNQLSAVSFKKLQRISIKPEMKQKLRLFMDDIYHDFVGIRLKSKQFIDDLEKWGNLMTGDSIEKE